MIEIIGLIAGIAIFAIMVVLYCSTFRDLPKRPILADIIAWFMLAIALFAIFVYSSIVMDDTCVEYDSDYFDEPTIGEEKVLETSLTISAIQCPEGCIQELITFQNLSEEDYPKQYNLSYDLFLLQDNCGLVSLVYYVPTGRYRIHIYDSVKKLLGGYETDSPCQNITNTYDAIDIRCSEINEEITFQVLHEPEKYITREDCR
ncbi:hypothetical protein GF312_22240 [Candidatus Poribacteria bacterium]|nr:hypothetical protein [Candidatus Poribacteria bacterium]